MVLLSLSVLLTKSARPLSYTGGRQTAPSILQSTSRRHSPIDPSRYTPTDLATRVRIRNDGPYRVAHRDTPHQLHLTKHSRMDGKTVRLHVGHEITSISCWLGSKGHGAIGEFTSTVLDEPVDVVSAIQNRS
jgi:hypothetical protein